jgi:hypothetical protein
MEAHALGLAMRADNGLAIEFGNSDKPMSIAFGTGVEFRLANLATPAHLIEQAETYTKQKHCE